VQREYSSLEGFLLIKKPRDVTSYSLISRLKWIIGERVRIGHAGILDKFASGLLIVAIGRVATRELDQCMKLAKRYRAVGKLGQLTDSLDYQGVSVIDENPPLISLEQFQNVIALFGKAYEQTPPVFSALKHGGVSLSDLIRRGKKTVQEIERVVQFKKRTVDIHELRLIDFSYPYFTIEARVSHGTYIRSLVHDLAQKFGTHATTYALERTHIGPFAIAEATSLDMMIVCDDIKKHLIGVNHMLERIKMQS
jgi:tRNA pseudouridine55 synthase